MKKALAIVFVIAAALIVLFTIGSNKNIEKHNNNSRVERNDDSRPQGESVDSLDEYSNNSAKSRMGPEYFLSARPIEYGFMQYGRIKTDRRQPRAAPEVKRNPGQLEARSPEDAAWLDRMGYPTQSELDSLEATSESTLATRSSEGDVASMALLGEKQIREGKIAEGYSNLQDSAMLGSVWAILRLAENQKRAGNFGDAIALYNLASMRGDIESARLGMLEGLPTQLHQSQVVRVPTRTALFLASMQRIRATRGLPPFVFDLRPQQNVLPGSGEMIGIYPRSRNN